MKLGNSHISLVVDLPQTEDSGTLLAELKQAVAGMMKQRSGWKGPLLSCNTETSNDFNQCCEKSCPIDNFHERDIVS